MINIIFYTMSLIFSHIFNKCSQPIIAIAIATFASTNLIVFSQVWTDITLINELKVLWFNLICGMNVFW